MAPEYLVIAFWRPRSDDRSAGELWGHQESKQGSEGKYARFPGMGTGIIGSRGISLSNGVSLLTRSVPDPDVAPERVCRSWNCHPERSAVESRDLVRPKRRISANGEPQILRLRRLKPVASAQDEKLWEDDRTTSSWEDDNDERIAGIRRAGPSTRAEAWVGDANLVGVE
jgi:hypothetical protein